jgi:hypothetical protein
MLKALTTVALTIAATFAFGLSAGPAQAHVGFPDGSAAHAEGRCYELPKTVTYRVDNIGDRPLFYQVIFQNLDDGTRTAAPWSRIDPRASMAEIIQWPTFLGPVYRYQIYMHYARNINGYWYYRTDWIQGIGSNICTL